MNYFSHKKIIPFFLSCLLFISMNVFASALDDAKAQGLVGENQQGYLGVIVSSPETDALVKEINQKRKSKYQQLATKNAITLEQVEALAAKKTYSKTASGHYIWKNGKWTKK